MSEYLRLHFRIGDSFDAEYELIDWGEPWHGTHVRAIVKPNPSHTAAAQAEAAQVAGWIVGKENTPVIVAALYNAQLDANEAEARRKYPDYAFDPEPRMKGIAYIAWDVEPKWYPDFVPGTWHWEFHPLQEA
jgi:hypothetical protein